MTIVKDIASVFTKSCENCGGTPILNIQDTVLLVRCKNCDKISLLLFPITIDEHDI